MSWDSGEGSPFGDFDEVIHKIKRFFKEKRLKIPGGKWFVVGLVLVIIGIVFLTTTIYTVPTGHQGVILRFGKYVGSVAPGLHFKFPFGVDVAYKVHTEKVDTESFGFRTVHAGIRSRFERTATTERESLMLTGDLNVIDIEWIIQFRRENPRNFLFSVRDPVRAIRDISESAIRRIVGDWSFDYVLQNREQVNVLAKKELQDILDSYNSGIRIVNVRLVNVVPADPVKGAFNDVSEAQQEKEGLINQAQETYNKQIPKARGEADRTINMARGEALERVNRAMGDAARFRDVLKAYEGAKEVTKQRLYLEAIQEILPKAKRVYVIDSEQKGVLPLLQLQQIEGR